MCYIMMHIRKVSARWRIKWGGHIDFPVDAMHKSCELLELGIDIPMEYCGSWKKLTESESIWGHQLSNFLIFLGRWSCKFARFRDISTLFVSLDLTNMDQVCAVWCVSWEFWSLSSCENIGTGVPTPSSSWAMSTRGKPNYESNKLIAAILALSLGVLAIKAGADVVKLLVEEMLYFFLLDMNSGLNLTVLGLTDGGLFDGLFLAVGGVCDSWLSIDDCLLKGRACDGVVDMVFTFWFCGGLVFGWKFLLRRWDIKGEAI